MAPTLPILRPVRVTQRISRRTRVVWSAFGAAMALACGVLVLGDAQGPRPVPALSAVGGSDAGISPREAVLDRGRWNAIVIHHSGAPAGDAASIARMHGAEGLAGLGYHFVIGNGQGMPDGFVEVGPRWNRQLPGAHVASTRRFDGAVPAARSGLTPDELNLHAIGICLVGNGDRREFTDRQIDELASLVRRMQRTLGIPAERVFLHSDVASISSPGRFFPTSRFEEQLLRGNP
jgi:N-acetylmuramoyl-L-alanine amidase